MLMKLGKTDNSVLWEITGISQRFHFELNPKVGNGYVSAPKKNLQNVIPFDQNILPFHFETITP